LALSFSKQSSGQEYPYRFSQNIMPLLNGVSRVGPDAGVQENQETEHHASFLGCGTF